METLERLLRQFPDTPTGISTRLETLAGGAKQPPPSMFHFKADETSVAIKIDSRSPYQIKRDENGRFHLHCGDESLGEVRFTKRPSYTDKRTSDGESCAALLTQRGPFCILVSPLDSCAYYERCLEAILERVDPPEEIQIFSQAFDEEDQRDLKALGATNILFNLEVWNEWLWPELLPGKSKAVGREEWIRRLTMAVDIFGRGHVGTGFVGGYECAPRPGFLSRDEALKSYLEGFELLIERGIVPWFTVWTAVPMVGGFEIDDPPPSEFYLRLGQGLHELLEKHGVYPDLGFPSMGVNPPSLGLDCYYCFSMSFTRDYPRLIGRRRAAA